MPSATSQIRTALYVFAGLALVGWVLGLIGIAGTQAQCYHTPTVGSLALGGGGTSVFSNDLPLLGTRGLNRSYDCSRMYGYYWFMLAAEFVVLAALVTMAALGLLAASALGWMAWLAVLALLFIQGSDTFLAISHLGLTGRSYSYAALTAAGWIMMSIANLALIFLLGWRPRKMMTAAGGGGPIKY